jgi:SNF2 family DNA or RNA helicase
MTVNYKFKTKPYEHQVTALDRSINRKEYAFFAEMGAGKSKMLIDTMSNLYLRGEIDFALIIAPKGVYRNWTNKEIPDHFPDDVPHRVIRWVSTPNKAQQEEMRSVRKAFDGLTIFVMNVEAFSTIKGKGAGEWMAKVRGPRGLIGIDESTTIKNHKAKRTKALIKIAAGFKYRRIMTGSPITKEPMDIYAQAAFLGPRTLGYDSFYAFQARYAVTQKRTMGAHSFQQVVGYRNLDELTSKIDTFSYRVLKEDCLDLPPKTYTARYITLTKEQRQMYDQLRQEGFLMLDEGDMVSTPQVITLMLRLQQVMSGHLMTDDGELMTFPSGRLDALLEVAAETSGKMIVFARFRHSIQQVAEALNKEYGEGAAVTYFGDTKTEARDLAIKNFQDPAAKARFFVSNKTGAYGITLTEASTVVFYEADWNLEVRIQAEARAHRAGQTKPVTYVDLVAEGTIDEKIVENLRNKISMGAKVLGEEAREWLELKPKTK